MSRCEGELPPRLASELPLPPYSYVSGRFPHPVRDPRGHSFGRTFELPASSVPGEWRQLLPYLYGIDLFNYGYYWEAHEVWEGLWHACGRQGPMADFLKGLIKLAAAGVKAREAKPEGVRRHASRAGELFEQTARATPVTTRYMGLLLPELIAESSRLAEQPPELSPDRPSIPVEVVFSFALIPSRVE